MDMICMPNKGSRHTLIPYNNTNLRGIQNWVIPSLHRTSRDSASS